MQVADGVYQFKVPMKHNPLGFTYSYFLKESKTLIDTGIPDWGSFNALERQLSEQGTRIKDLERVIITHMHNDHVGLIEYIRQSVDVETIAHRIAEERQLEQIRVYKDMYKNTSEELQLMGGGSFQQFLSRFEHAFIEDSEPLRLDKLLEDGDTIDLSGVKLKVIWTPGHAAEHICLHDTDRRILFSGDHVLPKITSHVSLHTWENRDPLRDYLNSLNKVKDLPVDLILPGHETNFTDLRGRVTQLLAHHEARLTEVKEALNSGKSTIFDVAGTIHWDSRPWRLMDFWTKRMAAAETYAHLVYLRNKGEVKETIKENTLHYSLS
ncbi:MAG: MBL fold metallo-hydrolase [Candidatus Bathyarchaeia archaeon]|jgi:glyoxylase-like metal-dependent hydrolase (beta-lactamase superfamily II)